MIQSFIIMYLLNFSMIICHCIMPLWMVTVKLFNYYYHMELLWIWRIGSVLINCEWFRTVTLCIDWFQFKCTPLHYASMNGHSKVVQLLLSHGATVDMKDRIVSTHKLWMIQSIYIMYWLISVWLYSIALCLWEWSQWSCSTITIIWSK